MDKPKRVKIEYCHSHIEISRILGISFSMVKQLERSALKKIGLTLQDSDYLEKYEINKEIK
ncbi:hypothetical protein SAMN06313540_11213 [Epsilonproteobacteria bacterium SCGC AD-308-E02]|jgi:DNA-directed RNA polymerase specialized sigma24 family protein|nr:hypothetical protein SAMN06313540_11213 [Epsilonproteobacteria bacterium SCGC AD-308-E02]